MTSVEILKSKVLVNIEVSDDKKEVIFTCNDGEKYIMLHYQDWCEHVYLEDICGNLNDLLGVPIITAESVSQIDDDACESGRWTFYKFLTCKGYVTLRWYGSSNGYYSESVDFEKLNENTELQLN